MGSRTGRAGRGAPAEPGAHLWGCQGAQCVHVWIHAQVLATARAMPCKRHALELFIIEQAGTLY